MNSSFSLLNCSTENDSAIEENCTYNQNCFPPESQFGNVEYKLKIVYPTKQRFEHLVTQLKWRLNEGNGEAIYEIGVEDDGSFTGLTKRDMSISLHTLEQMAFKLGATTTLLGKKSFSNKRSIAEVIVRKVPNNQNYTEMRVAVLGHADAGKSTLLGVLTQGNLDNGHGSARLNMFRHLHEIHSGRTSSISHEVLSFDSKGQPIHYASSALITPREICNNSTKFVTFLDMAGHKKYLKTTIHGLCGYSPHHAILVISSTAGAVGMASEHLAIGLALNVPYSIVITKIDLMDPSNILRKLESFLQQIDNRRVSLIIIKTLDDVMAACANQLAEYIVPIFCVSSVTGEGLELLTKFLYIFSTDNTSKENQKLEQESPEFHIDEHFKVDDTGQVLGGLLIQGVITEGTPMCIGPMNDGSFQNTVVKSIHRNRLPCRMILADHSAAICLNTYISNLRNGMVLVSPNKKPIGCLYFQAKVSVLFHARAIFPGFQSTIYIGNIRQTAVIIGIFSSECIQTNETDSVLFKFKCRPEYVTVGQRLLFKNGASKGIGIVTQVFPSF